MVLQVTAFVVQEDALPTVREQRLQCNMTATGVLAAEDGCSSYRGRCVSENVALAVGAPHVGLSCSQF